MTLADHSVAPPPEQGVTLWGAPGSGKSGLLGALYAASLRRGADGWSAHVKDCDDEHSQERLKEAYLGLLERNNAKTGIAAGGYQPLRLTLRRTRGRRSVAAVRVALVDPAGEFSTQLELGSTPEGRALFARVARGGGVLWLFEARAEGGDDVTGRMLTLQHLVALLEQTGGVQLGIPVALCLSKVDCLPPERRAAARRDPEAALREHLGEAAFTWFEAVCPVKRCFAISSAGSATGPIQPEGLDDVFDWLATVTRRPVSWRERIGTLFGALPPAARGAVGVAALAVAGLGAAGGLALATPHAAAWVARLVRPDSAAAADAVSRPPVRDPRGAAVREVDRGEVVSPATRPASRRSSAAARRARDGAAASSGIALDASTAGVLLDEARDVARHGNWLAALRTLGDDTPPASLRYAWDSLYLAAALGALRRGEVADAHALLGRVHARASDVVRRGPPGARRLVVARYARAVACVDARLGCPRGQVWEDLTWALLGPREMRRDAKARLQALASDARGTSSK